MTQAYTDLQANLSNASLRDKSTFIISHIECNLLGNPTVIVGTIGDSDAVVNWSPTGFRAGSGADRSKDLIMNMTFVQTIGSTS